MNSLFSLPQFSDLVKGVSNLDAWSICVYILLYLKCPPFYYLLWFCFQSLNKILTTTLPFKLSSGSLKLSCSRPSFLHICKVSNNMALICYSRFFLSLFLVIYFVFLFNPNLTYLPKQFSPLCFCTWSLWNEPSFPQDASCWILSDQSWCFLLSGPLYLSPAARLSTYEPGTEFLCSPQHFGILLTTITALVWHSLGCITLQCYINVSFFFLLQIPCG